MKNHVLTVALTLVAGALAAAPNDLFVGYEQARQRLIKGSVADVQAGAKQLTTVARAEKQGAIAAKAAALAAAKDFQTPRTTSWC